MTDVDMKLTIRMQIIAQQDLNSNAPMLLITLTKSVTEQTESSVLHKEIVLITGIPRPNPRKVRQSGFYL